ncbi:MAG: alanine--tRNA ligase-related protein, partial [Candidatus Phytoplasma mali]|nr:alanine--tRNA ligase-related protein [Candidatus Phytoplasma mali]
LIIQDLENDRFIEIWNIVFSQYNCDPKLPIEKYQELPSKNIDTGAGLERLACILQNTKTNFETDLFFPLIKALEKMTQIKYTGQE